MTVPIACARAVAAAALAASVAGSTVEAQAPAAAPPANAVAIVGVSGCLREQGADNWVVVAATDPVPSIANTPLKRDLPTTAPAGKNAFKLIGVSEFSLPSYRDRTVVVRGLLIEADPISRINLTAIAEALPACAPGAPK